MAEQIDVVGKDGRKGEKAESDSRLVPELEKVIDEQKQTASLPSAQDRNKWHKGVPDPDYNEEQPQV